MTVRKREGKAKQKLQNKSCIMFAKYHERHRRKISRDHFIIHARDFEIMPPTNIPLIFSKVLEHCRMFYDPMQNIKTME